MAQLIVPPLEGDGAWPSLGPQVADWQEAMLAFGPGDLLGKPYRVDDEGLALLERMYQVYPPDHRGACLFAPETGGWRCSRGSGRCGRRRFDTCVLMTRKGTMKSERAGALGAAELGADAPVRCDGFRRVDGQWQPVGRPVVSPFVFIFAFAKEQAEDTAWDSLTKMIELGAGAEQFRVWEQRILRSDGTGEAKALANAPDSRDGGRTTFQIKEETHRLNSPRHLEAHRTTVGNLSKRPIADPWEAHFTTMYAPGEGSVAELMHDAARKLSPEHAKTSRMFFFYRWADERIRIHNEDGSYDVDALRRAVLDASGPVVGRWTDADDVVHRQFLEAGADGTYAERVWLNRGRRRLQLAFDAEGWKRNARPRQRIADGALVVAGFDGSRGSDDPNRIPDHTGLVVTEIETGFTATFGHWDPLDYPDRRIPRQEVDVAVDELMRRFNVWRLYPDPPDWRSEIAAWIAKYGDKVVLPWETYRERPIGAACANFAQAIDTGELIHDGDPVLAAHVGHAHRRLLNARNDKGERLWTISKETPGSALKIDLAMAALLAWEARRDAIASGVLNLEIEPPSIYETRGLAILGEPLQAGGRA